jgi:hypothetical protein
MNFVSPGIPMAAANNKVNHANVVKNTTAAAANASTKAPVRATNEVG